MLHLIIDPAFIPLYSLLMVSILGVCIIKDMLVNRSDLKDRF